MYYTPEIIDSIVEHTNDYIREPQDDSSVNARANQWYPTSRGEIYVYLAIRIYMTLYICNEISDYWDIKDFTPIYPISKELPRNRFQELHMRVRLARSDAIGPYARVRIPRILLIFKVLLF
jgi:Transposase IS4